MLKTLCGKPVYFLRTHCGIVSGRLSTNQSSLSQCGAYSVNNYQLFSVFTPLSTWVMNTFFSHNSLCYQLAFPHNPHALLSVSSHRKSKKGL